MTGRRSGVFLEASPRFSSCITSVPAMLERKPRERNESGAHIIETDYWQVEEGAMSSATINASVGTEDISTPGRAEPSVQ